MDTNKHEFCLSSLCKAEGTHHKDVALTQAGKLSACAKVITDGEIFGE